MRYCLVCLMGSGLESVYLKLFGLVSVKVFELVYEYSKLYCSVYLMGSELEFGCLMQYLTVFGLGYLMESELGFVYWKLFDLVCLGRCLSIGSCLAWCIAWGLGRGLGI